MKNFTRAAIVAGLAMTAILLAGCTQQQGVVGEVHWHADFKVYLHGAQFNFSQPKYMSAENGALSPFMHLHDGDGEIIHKHVQSFKLGLFFKSLNMTFNNACLVTDDGKSYCNDGTNTLKFFVNGQPNSHFGDYEVQDLDRILISYGHGSEEQIKTQIDSVSSRACIFSEKCPEKGKPPSNESGCTVSGGCKA